MLSSFLTSVFRSVSFSISSLKALAKMSDSAKPLVASTMVSEPPEAFELEQPAAARAIVRSKTPMIRSLPPLLTIDLFLFTVFMV
ncbi:hypothetical protein D3C81_1838090 [compost metagenome]